MTFVLVFFIVPAGASIVDPEPRSRNFIASRSRNYELRLRLLSIPHRLEEMLYEKIMVAEEVFVNWYNFNPIT
jgi:hypothetical protein